jgi:hypothetical protein
MSREHPWNTGFSSLPHHFEKSHQTTTKQSWMQLAPLIKEAELNNHFLESISVTYSLSL